ncbi:hypothetical protein [Thermaurantiacus sp.]
MSTMHPVDIDLDVHKRIESERRSFEDTPNSILRRLLGIDQPPQAGAEPVLPSRPIGKAWSGKGVVLPHGTELRMEYNGVEHGGRIEDGKWLVAGKKANGPSPAAAAVAVTKDGKTPSLNGWIYWQAKFPGTSKWVPIKELRGF